MPPKKKARKAPSTPSGDVPDQPAEEVPEPMELDSGKEDLVLDAWTDEQETSLFKSMIRWKPVGMHKHFRMIAISENLRNHGYTSAKDDHTRIPGIWEKLGALYNLEALDERENDVGHIGADDKTPANEPFFGFALPDDEYGEEIVARRVAREGSDSPPALQHDELGGSGPVTRRQSTIDDTEDPKSSSASTPRQASIRGTRNRPTGGSQLKEVSVPITVRGRPSRTNQNAKKYDPDDEDDEQEEAEATPKTASKAKGPSKASGSTVSRRKSVRRR